MTAQVGAARLLFGMGRENVIPKRVFGQLHPVHNTPDVNVIMIGDLAFAGEQVIVADITLDSRWKEYGWCPMDCPRRKVK